MTPRAFRTLCQSHSAKRAPRDTVRVFSPGEHFAFDLYRKLRDDAHSPLQAVLTSVIRPEMVENGLIAVRCRVSALELAGTCDREVLQDWRSLEAVLVALYELCTGGPETGE